MVDQELPIIQKTYDLILWYIPHVNKMPRNHRFGLGDRITTRLYHVLEELIRAWYARENQYLVQQIKITTGWKLTLGNDWFLTHPEVLATNNHENARSG